MYGTVLGSIVHEFRFYMQNVLTFSVCYLRVLTVIWDRADREEEHLLEAGRGRQAVPVLRPHCQAVAAGWQSGLPQRWPSWVVTEVPPVQNP